MTIGQKIFIEMFILFFGIFFLYSAITKDPWFWDNEATKELITHFGKRATRILEFFFGIFASSLVILMLIRL